MKAQYFKEWPEEETNIPWAKAGRKKLNVLIGLVNSWTLQDCPIAESKLILNALDMGMQTFGTTDGGQEWLELMETMKAYVKEMVP